MDSTSGATPTVTHGNFSPTHAPNEVGACRRPDRTAGLTARARDARQMKTNGRPLMTAALALVLAVLVACSGYDSSSPTYPGVTTPPPPAPVLLKDVVID